MNTALKLNKKQLFSLYEKSSDFVKKSLRMEFGENFFMNNEVKAEVIPVLVRNTKLKNKNNKRLFIDWKVMFDFTPILRLAVYISLILIIFS